jgi:hypothetical protein
MQPSALNIVVWQPGSLQALNWRSVTKQEPFRSRSYGYAELQLRLLVDFRSHGMMRGNQVLHGLEKCAKLIDVE